MVNLFNLTDDVQTVRFFIAFEKLGDQKKWAVEGADALTQEDGLFLTAALPPMSPGLVLIRNEG